MHCRLCFTTYLPWNEASKFAPENRPKMGKRRIVFQPSIFRGELAGFVSGRGTRLDRFKSIMYCVVVTWLSVSFFRTWIWISWRKHTPPVPTNIAGRKFPHLQHLHSGSIFQPTILVYRSVVQKTTQLFGLSCNNFWWQATCIAASKPNISRTSRIFMPSICVFSPGEKNTLPIGNGQGRITIIHIMGSGRSIL